MKRALLCLLLVSSPLWATAYTASQTGNWNVAATWGGAGVPGFGDTAKIGHFTVTCPTGATCNIGTVHASFPYATDDLILVGDATAKSDLVVQTGATFVVRGQASLQSLTYYSTAQRAQLDFNTDSLVEFDEGSGSIPSRFYLPAAASSINDTIAWVDINVGTSGDPFNVIGACGTTYACTRITSINNASSNGILLDDSQAQGFSASTIIFYGATIDKLGSSSAAWLQLEMYQASGGFTWDHTSIDSSGYVSIGAAVGIVSGTTNLITRSVQSTNRLALTDLYWNVQTGLTVTGTREISNSHIGIGSSSGYGVANVGFNIFDDVFDFFHTNNSAPLAAADASGLFHDSIILNSIDCDESAAGVAYVNAVTVDNVASICTNASGNSGHFVSLWNSSTGGTQTMSNLIVDQQTTQAGGHGIIIGDPSGNNTFTQTMKNILVLQNQVTGNQGVGLTQWSTNNAPPTWNLTHVTQGGGPSGNYLGIIYFPDIATAVIPSTVLNAYKYNLFYGDSTSAQYAIEMLGTVPHSEPANLVLPANVSYNANYHAASASRWITTYSPCSSGTPCTSNGSPYDLSTTVTVPGANDIDGVNPRLAYQAGSSLVWAGLLGQASSIAGISAAFVAVGPSGIPALMANLFFTLRHWNSPEEPRMWKATNESPATDMGAVDLPMVQHIPPPMISF